MNTITKSSYVSFYANDTYTNELIDYLLQGCKRIKHNEPHTVFWTLLKSSQDELLIFDLFYNEKSRQEHFEGAIAKALQNNAAKWIKNGWKEGFTDNINHSNVLSAKHASSYNTIKKAVLIPVTAKEGKEQDVADFLTQAVNTIKENEPETIYWYALQLTKNQFAIIDFFNDEEGIKKHFDGTIASALKDNAENLIEGGWEQGVLNNVSQFDVLTFSDNLNA